jgi:hypothetical protein
MTGEVPSDRSAQISNARIVGLQFASSLVAEGYDPHCVAEGLLHAAREILADDHEFLTVMIGFLQFHSALAARFKSIFR